MISGLIIGLWILTIPARLLVVWILIRHRLIPSFPILAAWLVSTAALSTYLIYLAFWDRAAYGPMLSTAAPWTLAGEVLITIECFFVLCRHLPKAHWFLVVIGILALLGMLVVLATSDLDIPAWDYVRAPLLVLRRHFALFCLVIVALSRWFMAQFQPSANATRYAEAAIVYFAAELASHWLMRASVGNYWIVGAGQVMLQGGALSAYLLWRTLTAAGQVYAVPVAGMTIEEAERRSAGLRRSLKNALKSTFR